MLALRQNGDLVSHRVVVGIGSSDPDEDKCKEMDESKDVSLNACCLSFSLCVCLASSASISGGCEEWR